MIPAVRLTIALVPIMLLGGLFLSACGPIAAQEVIRITPLPAGFQPATATPQPTPLVAIQSDHDAATATPTPLNIQLEAGSAAAIAMATDAAMQPQIDNPVQFDESPVPITFDEFYDGFDMRKGLLLTDKLRSLDGQEVVMEGYMAPPLKPQIDWFVLTSVRLEFCPFCSSGADWPTDIAVVYMKEGALVATQVPVRIQGRMEIGQAVDPETGMVSLVRIYADDVKLLQ